MQAGSFAWQLSQYGSLSDQFGKRIAKRKFLKCYSLFVASTAFACEAMISLLLREIAGTLRLVVRVY